jgi:hypothetical protein
MVRSLNRYIIKTENEIRTNIARLRSDVQTAWKEACAHDKIDPASTFVVFSDSNPFEAEYNKAMGRYLDYRREVKL